MKIIKEGDPGKLDIRRFTCSVCGCVFDAKYGEWQYPPAGRLNGIKCVCECPYCSSKAVILKTEEENKADRELELLLKPCKKHLKVGDVK